MAEKKSKLYSTINLLQNFLFKYSSVASPRIFKKLFQSQTFEEFSNRQHQFEKDLKQALPNEILTLIVIEIFMSSKKTDSRRDLKNISKLNKQ